MSFSAATNSIRWTAISERRLAGGAIKTRPEAAFHRQAATAFCARRSTRAFTLLELLVAVAITAVLVGFIVIVVANVSAFWTRSSGRLSAEAQARYILDQLTLDLQSAHYRDDGKIHLAADVLTDTSNSGVWASSPGNTAKPASAAGTALSYDAPDLAQATFGQAGVWLRFFTTKRGGNTDGQTLSAPIAVGWQIIRRAATNTPNSRDLRYFLHRGEVSPTQTLQSGFDLAAPAYAGSGSPLRVPSLDAIVGDNVIDFGVRFYAHDQTGALARIFPRTNELSHRASNRPGRGEPVTQFPAVVDVFVRILTDEGARLIAGFEANAGSGSRPFEYASDAEYWWALALAHSRVFTRRIVLPGNMH
jgi:prepilin-type N-terminal cleavage/methylation domain-containing protein